MKRMVLFLMICMVAGSLYAQKYAIIHSQNILSALPEYTSAQEQVARLQEQYQQKLQTEYDALEALFQQYQNEKATLNAQQRRTFEQEIIDREKEVKQLQEQYFGQEGTLAKTTEVLFKPIQERMQDTVREIAESYGYSMVLDVSAGMGVVYYIPDIDISNLVIERLQGVR
ncbi:MAG: OmpH family outer membrane protein [Bacteroidales bacterium]|jgi:outer membrane protein|nr:OmpH family outer membrane protein [Bacteroidales bacterium]NLH23015.1 OmpH family outer membrane protein [Bacteroidales bacterium]